MSQAVTVAGRQGGGKEINEHHNETKKKTELGNVTWRPRRVTSPQRLKRPMK
jgi:hypothetical protein